MQQQQQHNRVLARRVDRYDGSLIWSEGRARYELGNYLGGGAAGVVYEAMDLEEAFDGMGGHGRSVAIKILNPVGFRLLPSGALQRCLVAVKGAPLVGGGRGARLGEENVWWLLHTPSKTVVAAYADPKLGTLRELPLPQCIQIWGWDGLGGGADHVNSFHAHHRARPYHHQRQQRQHQQQQQYQHQHQQQPQQRYQGHYGWGSQGGDEGGGYLDPEAQESKMGASSSSSSGYAPTDAAAAEQEEDDLLAKVARLGREVLVGGVPVFVPRVPAKYLNWLRSRRRIYKEISSMERLGAHPNVVRLEEVLELVQDSKSTLFLVLELVTGGELFDRIPLGCGTTEETARRYVGQLLSGVAYCHRRGVCHRDIKPENLLLDEQLNLKVADFGLSTAFAIAAGGGGDVMAGDGSGGSSSVRRLRSVVGSPHYVAPEVGSGGGEQGYDGRKADAWSVGVIAYALLAGRLPFGRELSQCPRFQRFRRWVAAAASPLPSPASATEGGGAGSSGSNSPSAARAGSGGGSAAAAEVGAEEEAEAVVATTTSSSASPWLFPAHVTPAARLLVVQLLHPDPARRLSIEAAARHPWVLPNGGGSSSGGSSSSSEAPTASAVVVVAAPGGASAAGARSVSPPLSASSSAAEIAAAAAPSVAAVAGGGLPPMPPARAPSPSESMSMQAVLKALRSVSEGHEQHQQQHQQPPPLHLHCQDQHQHQHPQELAQLLSHGLTTPSPPPPPILEANEEEEDGEDSLFAASPGRPA